MSDIIIGYTTRASGTKNPAILKSGLRSQGVLLIGKPGVGKSTQCLNMAISDLRSGAGVCFIDVHGDAAQTLLGYVPKSRTNQVAYISPADEEYVVGLNFLHPRPGQPKFLIANEIVSSFRDLFSAEGGWGYQSENLLLAAALAVLDSPNPNLLGIYRTLVDSDYRSEIVANVQNPMVKHFWLQVFAKWPASFVATATAPLVNKLGPFLMNPTLHNMVTSRPTLNLQELMDSEGICIVNLGAGRIGQAQARLFGSLLINHLYLLALARQSQPEHERRDFYLYVEEAHSFAGDGLAHILTQARKFKLNLTLNFQFLDELNEHTRAAVLGSVGTLISFRVGVIDGEHLEKEFRPQFKVDELRSQQNHHIIYRRLGEGLSGLPTSASTYPLLPLRGDEADPATIIRVSRERYTRPRHQVEQEINRRWDHFSQQ